MEMSESQYKIEFQMFSGMANHYIYHRAMDVGRISFQSGINIFYNFVL